MKETMTIHQALVELKTLNVRINDMIHGATFVVANKHSNSKIGGMPIKDYVAETKQAYQSVRTLINRRNAIKRAIVLSNAKTMVTIGGREYAVAEAIDMKASGIGYYTVLLSQIAKQIKEAKNSADRSNGDNLDNRADQYIQSLYANTELKNMSEEIKRMRDDFITAQTVEIVDPIGAVEESEKLRDYRDKFMSEIDAALSVSNALTTIEVEYETM